MTPSYPPSPRSRQQMFSHREPKSGFLAVIHKAPLRSLACLSLLSSLVPAMADTPAYNVINLGSLGTDNSFAGGINDAGQVVGWSAGHAVYFGSTAGNAENIDLGGLGGGSRAFGINNAGQIVGSSAFDFGSRATLFSLAAGDAGNIDLGHFETFAWNAAATAINNQGQIVGWRQDGGNANSATLFSPTAGDAGNVALGALNSHWNGWAYGINDNGDIVGRANVHNFASVPTLFSPTEGNAGNVELYGGSGAAYGINDHGQAVGNYGTPVLFDPIAGVVPLDNSVANVGAIGINNFEQIVGGLNSTGVLWQDGVQYRLDDLVGGAATNILIAGDDNNVGTRMINDWGQIAITGDIAGEGTRALLLNPTTPNTSLVDGTRNTKFVAGMDYSLFTETARSEGSFTAVNLLGGEAGSGDAGAYGFNRDVTVSFSDGGEGLFSDIVSLTGTENDVFILSLSYAAELFLDGEAVLSWLDGGEWKPAVAGNSGSGDLAGSYALSFNDFLTTYNSGTFDPSLMLGAYGSAGGHAWAVLDHNSDFAILGGGEASSPVPEPGSAATLALLLAAPLCFRHRRRMSASAA